MIKYELDKERGILLLSPTGALQSSDFAQVAADIDPYIENNGDLKGLLIHAKSFPGWKDFSAFIAHMKFVKNHHEHIEKVAISTDDSVMHFFPKIARHFVKAEIKQFEYSQQDKAISWLLGNR